MKIKALVVSTLIMSLGVGYLYTPLANAQDAAAPAGDTAQSGQPFRTMQDMLDALGEKPQEKGKKQKGAARSAQQAKIAVGILFKYDSTEIMPGSMAQVQEMGKALTDEKLKTWTFELAGHTDTTGDADYNMKLSQQRADAVKDYLVKNYSIEADRLVSKGYGETKPEVTPDDTDAKRLQNRRVEIVRMERYKPNAAAAGQ